MLLSPSRLTFQPSSCSATEDFTHHLQLLTAMLREMAATVLMGQHLLLESCQQLIQLLSTWYETASSHLRQTQKLQQKHHQLESQEHITVYYLAIYTVLLYINCTAEEGMNHTCSAVAACRQTQSNAGSLLCPTPLAPPRPCLWVSFPELLVLGLLRSPRVGILPGSGYSCSRAGHCVPGLCSAGGSGSEPLTRAGDAAGTTLLFPKCFPNTNRCPCPLRKINVRDLKVEAGKLRHGEAMRVRQVPYGCWHPSSRALH